MNLQELIEKGIVTKIETDETHLGDGYKIYVHLHNYSIGSVIIDIGIDEYLTDAITLINKMVEVDEEITKKKAYEKKHLVDIPSPEKVPVLDDKEDKLEKEDIDLPF